MKIFSQYFLLCFFITVVAGCAQPKPTFIPRDEADRRFVEILENDYSLTPVLRWAGQTLWVYNPVEHDIYGFSAGQKSSAPSRRQFSLQYLKVEFNDRAFLIEYDVVPATKIDLGSGIGTKYSTEYSELSRNMTTAISRSFLSSEAPPDFIVTATADIRNGLKITNVLFLNDLRKYYSGGLPPDEYSLRVQNATEGNQEIIEDRLGAHLEFSEVKWPTFLCDQIMQRSKFKFQQSDFPPDETPESEILKQVVLTLQAYDFDAFDVVELKNLREETSTTVTKQEIDALKDPGARAKEEQHQGRIVTIDFGHLFDHSSEKDQ